MGKFKVGDRVRFTSDAIGIKLTGKTGTVIPDKDCVILPGEGATVRLDMPVKDFSFEGGMRDWVWVFDHKLELIKPEKQPVIVITSDGKTTTATKRLGKKVLGTAYSKCAPADTFDYDTGVGLALARLCGFKIQIHEEEPQPPKKYTHKVVCVESVTKWWTVGKIYECKDGVLQDDSGLNRDRSICTFPKDIDELNSTWWDTPNGREARFIELVED